MEIFKEFIINNFLLFCIGLVLVSNSIIRYKQHTRISLYTILLMFNALLIALAVLLANIGKAYSNIMLATVFSMLGYDLRPICIFFIIMMTGKVSSKNKLFFLYYVPLIINAIVYLFALFPNTKETIFYFANNDMGGISFHGGPLRFSSHIISGLYLIFLLYISFTKINSKHIWHGLTIIFCSLFVVLAVIIEAFWNDSGEIEILNNTIAVSALVYYLYLYIERTQIDTLTGLFNRETYYHDVQKMGNHITGVIQFDMNGLKYLNDNFGHLEGDKALATIADVISKAAKHNMYVYRLGGDEYIILCHNGSEEDIIETVNRFKEGLKKTDYYCSYGYSYRSKNKNISIEELLKEAEKKMYEDKERFYKNSPFERRSST